MNRCSKCGSSNLVGKTLAIIHTNKGSFSESVVEYICQSGSCGNIWFACDGSCSAIQKRNYGQKRFVRKTNAVRHLKTFHAHALIDMGEPTLSTPNNLTDDLMETEIPEQQNDSIDIDDTHALSNILSYNEVVEQTFENYHLHEYLQLVKSNGYYPAVSRLVCRAAFSCKDTGKRMADSGRIPTAWVLLFLNIALIVTGMSTAKQATLAEILQFLLSFLPETMLAILPIPCTLPGFLSKIKNRTNSNSFHSLLPIPLSHFNADTEHACSNILEVVPQAMLLPNLNSNVEVHPRYRSVVNSVHFKEQRGKIIPLSMLSTELRVLAYVTVWSDGWDPNSSNKGNRYPVWTATGTIIFVELGQNDVPYLVVTQLLASGPGKADHNEFFESLAVQKEREWEDCGGSLIPYRCFSKHHNKNVIVYFAIGFFLQDNPERRSACGLLAGNSNLHALFGISCHFGLLNIPFAACSRCKDHIETYIQTEDWSVDCTPICADCLSWSIDRLCNEGKYINPLIDIDLQPDEHGYHLIHGPGRLTFESCQSAWDLALIKFSQEGVWTEFDCRRYLKLFCFNDKVVEQFVDQARMYLKLQEAKDPLTEAFEEQTEIDCVLRDSTVNPAAYLRPTSPGIFRLANIDDITETPMHLAMNAQKAVLKSTFTYTTARSQSPDYTKRCKTLLMLIKEVSINILPVLTFKDSKFGGFVAENYAAVTMILPWLSRVLEEDDMIVGPLTEPPDPTVKAYSTWNGKECKAWLSARAVPKVSTLSKLEAQLMVKRYLEGPSECIPLLVPNLGRQMNPSVIRKLHETTQVMFSCLFATDLKGIEGCNRSTALARNFLSVYEDIDNLLLPNRDKPIWLAKFNMLGLLRAPNHFLRHELVRNLHEGGLQGEGIVKILRKLCPTGIRPGWSLNLNDSFYRMNAVDTLRREIRMKKANDTKIPLQEDIPNPNCMTEYDNRKFSRYKSKCYVEHFLMRGVPLSVVIFRDFREGNQFVVGAMISQVNRWFYLIIDLDTRHGWKDPNGFEYFPVRITGEEMEVMDKSILFIPGLSYHSCGILLPDLWGSENLPLPEDEENYAFSLVIANWERFCRPGRFSKYN